MKPTALSATRHVDTPNAPTTPFTWAKRLVTLADVSLTRTASAGVTLLGEALKDHHPNIKQNAQQISAALDQRAQLRLDDAHALGAITEPEKIHRLGDLGNYTLSLVAQGAGPMAAAALATRGGLPGIVLTTHLINTAFNAHLQEQTTGHIDLTQATLKAIPATVTQLGVATALPRVSVSQWPIYGATAGSVTAASQQASVFGWSMDLWHDAGVGRGFFDGGLAGSVLGPFVMGARPYPELHTFRPFNPPSINSTWLVPQGELAFAGAQPPAAPTALAAPVLYSQAHRPPSSSGTKTSPQQTRAQTWDNARSQIPEAWLNPMRFLFELSGVRPEHLANLPPRAAHHLLTKITQAINPHLDTPLPIPRLPDQYLSTQQSDVNVAISRSLGLRADPWQALDQLNQHRLQIPDALHRVLPEVQAPLQMLLDMRRRLLERIDPRPQQEDTSSSADPLGNTSAAHRQTPAPIQPAATTATARQIEPSLANTTPTPAPVSVPVHKPIKNPPESTVLAITPKDTDPALPKKAASTTTKRKRIRKSTAKAPRPPRPGQPLSSDLTRYNLNAPQVVLLEHLLAGHDYATIKAQMGDNLSGEVVRQVHLLRKKLGLADHANVADELRAHFSSPDFLSQALEALKSHTNTIADAHRRTMALTRSAVSTEHTTAVRPTLPPIPPLAIKDIFLRGAPQGHVAPLEARNLKPLSLNAQVALLRALDPSKTNTLAYSVELSTQAVEVFAEIAPTWLGVPSLKDLADGFKGGEAGLRDALQSSIKNRLHERAQRARSANRPEPHDTHQDASDVTVQRETVVRRLAQMSERDLKILWAYADGAFVGKEIAQMTGPSDNNVWQPMTSFAKALGIGNQRSNHLLALHSLTKPGQNPAEVLWKLITQRRRWAAEEKSLKQLSAKEIQRAYTTLETGQLLFLRAWAHHRDLSVKEFASVYPALKPRTIRHYRVAIYDAFNVQTIWELDAKLPQGLNALLDEWRIPEFAQSQNLQDAQSASANALEKR